MDYLDKQLSELFPDSKREEREDWISNYSQQIGTRFLDAVNLLPRLKVAKMKKKRKHKGCSGGVSDKEEMNLLRVNSQVHRHG